MKHQTAVLLGLLAGAGLFGGCPQRTSTASPSAAAGDAAPRAPTGAESSAAVGATKWEQLHSRDARTFAARLAAAGVPAPTARLLVADELRQQYLARLRELIGPADPEVFWQSANAAADRDKQAALRRLAAEQDELLHELFGPAEDGGAELERLQRAHGPLPDAKLRRLERITVDYGAMADDIRLRTGGVLLATDRELLALLEQEMRKDIVAVLTPEELELYDLQTSAPARRLRARLAAFAPTETEFRALYAAECAFEARCAQAAGDDAGLAAAERDLEAAIARALGPKRHAEFAAQQTPEYRVAARIAERFGVPTVRAAKVVALLEDTRGRLRALREDRTLSAATVRESVAALGGEVRARLAALLTADGAELFERTSCGAWLRALETVAARGANTEHAAVPDPSVALP